MPLSCSPAEPESPANSPANQNSGNVNRSATTPAFICLLGLWLALRLYGIERESLWLDELLSYRHLSYTESLADFLSAVSIENAPTTPIYFILEYFWGQHVSDTKTGVRLLSLLVAGISFTTLFALARKWFGPTGAAVTGITLALSPAHIYYDLEVRMYCLVVLLSAWSVWTLWLAVVERLRWAWFLHILVNFVLIWTHPFGSLLWVAQGLWLLFMYRNTILYTAVWGAGHAILAATVFRYLRIVGLEKVETQMSWVPPANLAALSNSILWPRIFLPPEAPQRWPLLGLLSLIPVIAVPVILWLRRADSKGTHPARNIYLLLFFWMFVPPISLYVISVLYSPAMVDRYVLFASSGLILLLAWAISLVKKPGLRFALVALIGGTMLLAHYDRPRPYRPNNAAAKAIIEEHAKPQDIIFTFQDWQLFVLQYYLSADLPYRVTQVSEWSEILDWCRSVLWPGRQAWVWFPRPGVLQQLQEAMTDTSFKIEVVGEAEDGVRLFRIRHLIAPSPDAPTAPGTH